MKRLDNRRKVWQNWDHEAIGGDGSPSMKKTKRAPHNGRSSPPSYLGNGKEQKEKIQKLELLLEYSRKNVPEKSIDSLLSLLADEAKSILTADRCTVFVLDKKRKVLWSKVAQGTNG